MYFYIIDRVFQLLYYNIGVYMKIVKYLILVSILFTLVGCNLKKEYSNNSSDVLSTLPKSWTTNKVNGDTDANGSMSTCFLARTDIVFDEVEFTYSISGSYNSIKFHSNTDEVEVTDEQNKVKLKYSELLYGNTPDSPGASVIAFCYTLDLYNMYDTTELNLTNILLRNSRNNRVYYADDIKDSISYR